MSVNTQDSKMYNIVPSNDQGEDFEMTSHYCLA